MLTVRTILHPTDFSPSSDAAFRHASAVARDYGARLILMHVVPQPLFQVEAAYVRRPGGPEDEAQARLLQLSPGKDIEATYRFMEGPVVESILETAAEEKCDLIVMGTHGRTGLRRAVLGSVAEAITRRAHCPVVTVREDQMPPPAPAPVVPDVAPVELGVGDPEKEVEIPAGPVALRGILRWPGKPRGVIVFAHGSGSGRLSPRNQHVAATLNQHGYATLLMDLLSDAEAEDREKVFDVDLLSGRLACAVAWLATQKEMAGLPVGYFGASTGAAAALAAAARYPGQVAAVVSRGGRPDLAWDDLPNVRTPTLLIVGGDDTRVWEWNRDSLDRLEGPKDLATIPGASHLFTEPGALDDVVRFARNWFDQYLAATPAAIP